MYRLVIVKIGYAVTSYVGEDTSTQGYHSISASGSGEPTHTREPPAFLI